MCLIVVKPEGVNLPDTPTIAKMYAANGDGFGLSYSIGDKVHIEKGAMTIETIILVNYFYQKLINRY